MRGVFSAMEEDGIPKIVIDSLRESIDCKLYFFDNEVTITAMYAIMAVSVVLLVGIYVLMNFINIKKHSKKKK